MTLEARLLHYEIERRLGEGGMGVVYRAIDTRLGRPVALKFLPEALARQPDAKQRLLLEARAAATLDHPNIGVIHDIEEVDGRLFIVMALYQGETLEERLARAPVGARDAAEWGLQAARGLAKAHAAGIVHRDIKPANLFLTSDGLLKILDFGLVKPGEEHGLTVPGTILGTPAYMAPEQIRGHAVDARADVWSLGVVLYEALTGVSPFDSDGGLPAIVLRVMTEEPERLDAVAPTLPSGFQRMVDRTLAKNPAERYASAGDVAVDLERILDDIVGARGAVPSLAAQAVVSPPTEVGAADTGDGRRPGPVSITEVSLPGAGRGQRNALLEAVPSAHRFVGRERELDELGVRLDRTGMAVIRGMAGDGKSALGARLVRDRYPEERVCWFTFDPIEKHTSDALYWAVAAFLEAAGEPLLWQYLQGEIEAHRPLDRTVRRNLFLSSLEGGRFAFCFDDVHLVASDPEIVELFKGLQRHRAGAAGSSGTAFVIMGRELPGDLEHMALSLTGLDRSGVEAVLAERGTRLPEDLVDRLAERTRGNPTLLELAIPALERMGDDSEAMASFVESMAGRSDIRDYVMNHVCADLSANERAVLDALSIFVGVVEPEAAEETLAECGVQGIAASVSALAQKAIVHETETGQLYCHDLVREFCYRSLDTRSRRTYHGHAARYYEAAKNPLRAAYHAFEQGDRERSLALLTAHRKTIIEAGGASSLLDQLTRFDPRDLDDDQQLTLVLAKGDALSVRGAYQQALELYEFALDDVFEEAGRAELLARLGHVCNQLGEYERAITYAQEALAAFEAEGLDAGAARAQRVLGTALLWLGRFAEAGAAYGTGLALAEAVGDDGLAATVGHYLGMVDMQEGRLEQARQRLEHSRRSFRAQRDRTGEAETLTNLAMVFDRLGRHDRVPSPLTRALEVFEQVGDVGALLVGYNNLAYHEHRAANYEVAMAHRERLIALARRIDHRPWEGAGLVGVADDLLALGRLADAEERARAAHDLLRALPSGDGPSVELALSERVLGDVRLAVGAFDEARAWFEASVPTLEAAHETDELAKARRGLEAALTALAGETPAEQEHVHDNA